MNPKILGPNFLGPQRFGPKPANRPGSGPLTDDDPDLARLAADDPLKGERDFTPRFRENGSLGEHCNMAETLDDRCNIAQILQKSRF